MRSSPIPLCLARHLVTRTTGFLSSRTRRPSMSGELKSTIHCHRETRSWASLYGCETMLPLVRNGLEPSAKVPRMIMVSTSQGSAMTWFYDLISLTTGSLGTIGGGLTTSRKADLIGRKNWDTRVFLTLAQGQPFHKWLSAA